MASQLPFSVRRRATDHADILLLPCAGCGARATVRRRIGGRLGELLGHGCGEDWGREERCLMLTRPFLEPSGTA